MKSVGIISDTHSYLDPAVFNYFEQCDEIWHAGDFGRGVAEALRDFKPLKGVFGNIDGEPVRNHYPEEIVFNCEGVKIFMIHIGGYPNNYAAGIRQKLGSFSPDIFVSGHSHILKIVRDPPLNNLLHINPGAAGKTGLHQVRTVVRLKIDARRIFDVEVIELGKRGQAVVKT